MAILGKILKGIFVFAFILETMSGFAKDYDLKVLEHHAYDLFMDEDYTEALPVYQKLFEIDSTNIVYIYPLGVSYLYQKNDSSLIYLSKCVSKKDTLPPKFDYYYAKALHLNAKYAQAVEYYDMFLSHVEEDHLGYLKQYAEHALHGKKQALTGDSLSKIPHEVEIKNLGISVNTSGHEYGPLMNYNESYLVFTSERLSDSVNHKADEYGRYFEDVYMSKKNNEEYAKPFKIRNLNTDGEDAAIFYSHCGNELLLYRFSKLKKQRASGNIYHTELIGDSTAEVIPYPEPINTKYRESSACLSPDGNRIYFSSNRPGGFGGMDIYYCFKKEDGSWSNAINLGESINTAYDEESPFLTPDKLNLFYCSNGDHSMGGFDFFLSHKDLNTMKWGKSVNLGIPLNTPHDDLYLQYSSYSNSIYFSSDRRMGLGGEDIYKASLEKDLIEVVHKCKFKINSTNEFTQGSFSLAVDDKQRIVGKYEFDSTGVLDVFVSEKHEYFALISLDNGSQKMLTIGEDIRCVDDQEQAIRLDD